MTACVVRRVSVVLGVLALLWSPSPASACSCATSDESPCALLAQSEMAVFRGTVLEIATETVARSGMPPVQVRRVRFSIDEAFSTVPGPTVDVRTSVDSCEFPFESGRAYLVYAYRTPSGLSTSMCSRTVQVEAAGDDIEVLRASQAGTVTPVLVGSVSLWVARMQGSALPVPYARLPSVKVTARAGGRAHETTTDADGAFRFLGLQPGEYTVQADPGSPFKPLFDDDAQPTVRLDRCLGEVDLHFTVSAFRGTVRRADGSPARGAQVVIIDADTPTPERTVRTNTDENGVWKVDGLGDGRYRVSASPASGGDNPEPRTWYPGVSSEAQAHAIVLRDQRPQQVDITVP